MAVLQHYIITCLIPKKNRCFNPAALRMLYVRHTTATYPWHGTGTGMGHKSPVASCTGDAQQASNMLDPCICPSSSKPHSAAAVRCSHCSQASGRSDDDEYLQEWCVHAGTAYMRRLPPRTHAAQTAHTHHSNSTTVTNQFHHVQGQQQLRCAAHTTAGARFAAWQDNRLQARLKQHTTLPGTSLYHRNVHP